MKFYSYEDGNSYSRNHVLGMTYINRFVIEEESQFECDGVFRVDAAPPGPPIHHDVIAQLNHRALPTTYGNNLLQLEFHVFISADFSLRSHLKVLSHLHGLRQNELMVTCIGSQRLECIQKEECEVFYNEKGRVRYSSDAMLHTVLDVQKSIGYGVEDFFQLIQMKMFRYKSVSQDRFENLVENFHTSMLTEEKQNEMLIQQNSGGNTLDFMNDTKLSENEQNYVLSICFRKTCKRNGALLYEIIDPNSTILTTTSNLPRQKWLRGPASATIIEQGKVPAGQEWLRGPKKSKKIKAKKRSNSRNSNFRGGLRWTT